MIRLNLYNTIKFDVHRSGWGYCVSKLRPFYSKNGILFDDFIERSFGWGVDEYYKKGLSYDRYKKDWVGVLHNPPNSPDWFDIANSPQAILDRDIFQKSLEYCKAMICLSDYLANYLKTRISAPIISVKHPTEIPRIKWDIKNFLKIKNKEVVQIGYWLRRMDSIHNIKCDSGYRKIWLPSNMDYAKYLFDIYKKTTKTCKETYYSWAGVHMTRISNEEFDYLLSRCVVFVDLYDSSANNAVVESIARNTPILINRIPATEEYLGKEYPLYFKDLDHASELLYDYDKIYEAHTYLKNMDKKWISGTYFANDLISKLDSVI